MGKEQYFIEQVEPMEKKRSKVLIIVLSSILAVVLLLFVWCSVNQILGGKYTEAGDFPAAVAAYQRNFLFGAEQENKALRLAGEAAFESADYQAATEYFRQMGADGEARLSDSICEYAKQLTKEGLPEEALVILEEIADEPRAKVEQAAAQLAIAQQLFENGAYNEAIAAAEKVDRSLNDELPSFLNKVYFAIANQERAIGNYQAVLDAYNTCTNNPAAEANAELLSLLLAGDYYTAAVRANNMILSRTTNLTRSQWVDVFNGIMKQPDTSDIDRFLLYGFVDATVTGRKDFDSGARYFPDFTTVGDSSRFPEGSCIVSSLSDLYKQCGTNPQDKILVVVQLHDYPNRETYQAIIPKSMASIPAAYYPSSLEEVGYIVLVSYDYTKVGAYGNTIDALQLKASVNVLKMPSQKQVFSSGTLKGEFPPNVIFYFTPREWESGTAPDISEKLHDAIASIIPAE